MSYNDNENSAEFYSNEFEGRRKPSDEPEVFTVKNDLDRIKQLVVSNIFPEAMGDIRMLLISLPNKCGIQAEPVYKYSESQLVENLDQINPFIEKMLETGESFVIGNKYTKECVKISMTKPDTFNSYRDGVSRILTKKRTSGTGRQIDK
jgi:hypothetical protein